jgi:ABC-type nickel/cobalt efflux system permease component RcnA
MTCSTRAVVAAVFLLACCGPALGHDIPNQRVDRAIQIVLQPGSVAIDYEISLSELTLTQDLRGLIGQLPGADRAGWFTEYGELTGPLNAKGFLISVNGEPITLAFRGFQLSVEEHPRYHFQFDAKIPDSGSFVFSDMNFVASEGTSRLAVRAKPGVILKNNDWPEDVQKVPIRPVWDLTDEEERRTRHASLEYQMSAAVFVPNPPASTQNPPQVPEPQTNQTRPANASTGAPRWSLSALLDRATTIAWPLLAGFAALLGAVHALQPGHGKTLVSAFAIGPDVRFYQPALVGLVATLAHTSSVLLIAVALWFTGSVAVESIHRGLSQIAGFVVGSIALWKLGQHLSGIDTNHKHKADQGFGTRLNLFTLGLAAGIVPCWDAVSLLLLAAAVGQLALGIQLVVCFSLGMAAVMVSFGSAAWKLKSESQNWNKLQPWQRPLELAGNLLLLTAGLFLFIQ